MITFTSFLSTLALLIAIYILTWKNCVMLRKQYPTSVEISEESRTKLFVYQVILHLQSGQSLRSINKMTWTSKAKRFMLLRLHHSIIPNYDFWSVFLLNLHSISTISPKTMELSDKWVLQRRLSLTPIYAPIFCFCIFFLKVRNKLQCCRNFL